MNNSLSIRVLNANTNVEIVPFIRQTGQCPILKEYRYFDVPNNLPLKLVILNTALMSARLNVLAYRDLILAPGEERTLTEARESVPLKFDENVPFVHGMAEFSADPTCWPPYCRNYDPNNPCELKFRLKFSSREE